MDMYIYPYVIRQNLIKVSYTLNIINQKEFGITTSSRPID